MRAVVVNEVGGPAVLTVSDVPTPRPGAGEVAIDVSYAGIGMVDVLFRSGRLPLMTPFTPGIEVTGRIREVGDGVDNLHDGQLIAALLNDFGRTQRAGGYAEVAIAHHTMITPLHENSDLPTVTGALINGVTAWLALHEMAHAAPSDTVVVLGASGGLGGIAARLAALVPCERVIGVVSRDPSRAPQQCTDVVLTEDLEQWVHGNTQIDVVIDPAGGRARDLTFHQLAPFGRHIVLGNASGEDQTVSTDQAWHNTTTLTGLSLGAIAHLRPDTVRTALQSIAALIDRGLLNEPTPDIQPINKVRDIHEAIENRTAPPKTVLALSQ